MNSLTYVHRWMTGLLDDWIIGLMVDHLDPETIRRYPAKAETWFVAPHLTALHLQELGVPTNRVVRMDVGETRTLGGVEVRGVFALPTGADVLDTTGYLLRFANERSVYHTSDTALHSLVLASAPREPDVMLVRVLSAKPEVSPNDK